jgi:hypothetical protein
MILFLLLAVGWQPGVTATRFYKHAENPIPGDSLYTLRSVMWEGKKTLEIEVLTRRTLVLGGQQGKLETRSLTLVDPDTFDLRHSRLTTTLNSAEASYLRAERQGSRIEVYQRLRGSGAETRVVDAPGVVLDESAQMFFVERLPLKKGARFSWQRFSASQARLTPTTVEVEAGEKDTLRVNLKTDIAPMVFHTGGGPPWRVLKTEAAGALQMTLEEK